MRSTNGCCRLDDDGAAGVKNCGGFLDATADDWGVEAGTAKREVALNCRAPCVATGVLLALALPATAAAAAPPPPAPP
jgi:hypothetical protein